MRRRSTWLLLAALAVPPPASGAEPPRLSVGAVQGEKGRGVSGPLSAALCAARTCVPRSEVTRRGKVDFARMERQAVAGLVFGSVSVKGGKPTAWLALVTRSMTPARTWTFPLDRKGRLPAGAVEEVVRDVDALLAPPAPRPDPLEFPAPPPPPPPPPPPEPRPAAAPPPPAPEAAAAPAPAASPAAVEPPAAGPPWVIAELGAFLTGRNLTYQGVPAGPSPLVGFRADAIAGPWAHVEAYPLARSGAGLAEGLGAYAEGGASIGLTATTSDAGGTTDLRAQMVMLQAGALWRVPIPGWRGSAVIPAVAYQLLSFTFDPAYPGLPDASLQGIRLALALDAPLGDAFALRLGFAWTPWLSSWQLVGSPDFFAAKGAYALSAELGLSWAIVPPVALRLTGTWDATSYALEADPGSAVQATGATDQYLGGRLTVRVAF